MRDVGLRSALGGLAAVAAIVAWPPPALAATDQITAIAGDVYTGGTGSASTEFLLDAGANPVFVNADTVESHNVVADDDGPDREPLFESSLTHHGQSSTVAGTQYLAPGTYRFLCTIHIGMEGSLTVSGPGAQPRPAVEVSIASSKLRRVAKGTLQVTLEGDVAASGVELEARLGPRVLATAEGIDVATGATRKLKLDLDNRARKSLEDREKARIVVDARVPFGPSASARRTLG